MSVAPRTGGVADRMDPVHLAAIKAMNATMNRLCVTDDPVEQERLLAEGRALLPAYRAAIDHMHQVGEATG